MDSNAKNPLIEWKDEYLVHVGIIDENHKKFVEIIQRLDKFIENPSGEESISGIFYALVHYVEHYLLQEEIYFKNYHFSDFSQHKDSHQYFISRIIRFREEYEKGSGSFCEEMREFLVQWFGEHILAYDKKAVDFLVEKGLYG